MWQKILDFLFNRPSPNFKEMIDNGATLLDVRTYQEFQTGHIDNSIHIPLDQIDEYMNKISKMKQPIISYCRSGRRSGIATSTFKSAGLEAYNGGGMNSLKKKLN